MINLYAANTPNGQKISIMLEELGLAYELHPVDLSKGEQESAAFLEMNPNGKIPVICDEGEGGFVVFESGAILLYLAEKEGKLIPADKEGRSIVMQWLMLQMGGVGPMLGQAWHFKQDAPQKVPYAEARYLKESRRLMEVLDGRLGGHEYLAGAYSIADIAHWCWARGREALFDTGDLKHLARWDKAIAERGAVQRGLAKLAG